MSGDNMMQPRDGQNLPAPIIERLGAMLAQMEQMMQSMANAIMAQDQRMEKLERQMMLMTPLTGAQEKALGEQIRQRAEELRVQYKLPASSLPSIANAIRKDLKLTGGVRAIRDLPRIEYAVYIDRVALWDDYTAMRAIRKAAK